uniref:Glyceraldehyde 3-phosphate dehydrogenase catalytic domain-containing protein n=1 Tax=Lynx canadensis TaxID=61383 RepID=A0A667GFX8_LYNCA
MRSMATLSRLPAIPSAPLTIWPLVKVIHDNFGITERLMPTVHAITATQKPWMAFPESCCVVTEEPSKTSSLPLMVWARSSLS